MAACPLMFPFRLRPTGQSFHTSRGQSFHTPLGGKFPYLYRVNVSIPLLCHFSCHPAPDSPAWLPMPSRSRGESIVTWGCPPHEKNISHCHSLAFSKAMLRPGPAWPLEPIPDIVVLRRRQSTFSRRLVFHVHGSTVSTCRRALHFPGAQNK